MAATDFIDAKEYYKDAEMELYTTPGEYVHKGDVYPGFCNKSLLSDPFSVVKPRKDDIIIAAYPKSGQTWTLEMTKLILECSGREDTLLKLDTLSQSKNKAFYLEFDAMASLKINFEGTINWLSGVLDASNMEKLKGTTAAQLYEMSPSPRVFKTHIPQQYILPLASKAGCKVISVARNPKDVCVSFYHHYLIDTLLNPSKEIISWNIFYNTFTRKNLFGGWFEQVNDWWNLRNEPNILFLKYEDMKEDHCGYVKKISEFLGYPLSEKAVDLVVKASSFSFMQKNKNLNFMQNERDKKHTFIRKGVVGNWKNFFTVAQSEEFDELYEEKLKEAQIYFKHFNS